MKIWLKAWLVLFGVVLVGATGFVYSGLYNIAADEPHWSSTKQILETLRDRSIQVRADDIDVPTGLDSAQMIAKGAGQYDAMCVNCHLAPGMKSSDIRPGLYPTPPDLSKHSVNPKKAFWVIKHGIKMSGMPAWGTNHDDATLWSVVAFLNKLPSMTEKEYESLTSQATGHGTEEAGEHGKQGHKH